MIVDIAEPHELAENNVTLFLKDIDAPDAIKSCPKQMELGQKVKDIVAQKLDLAGFDMYFGDVKEGRPES